MDVLNLHGALFSKRSKNGHAKGTFHTISIIPIIYKVLAPLLASITVFYITHFFYAKIKQIDR